MKTLKECLNNPAAKELIEMVEDLNSSLDSYPEGEATLEKMLADVKAELLADFGYAY